MVARSLAQTFKCATVSGASQKLTYIHICYRPLCMLSMTARGPKQTPVTVSPPPSVWENTQQFAFHRTNMNQSLFSA